MEDLSEKVAAHEATLTQMNEPLGNIEATLRDLTGRLDAGFRDITGRLDAGLRDVNHRMVSAGEVRTWSGLLIALIGAAVGIILKYS
jgi:hypothetical protein